MKPMNKQQAKEEFVNTILAQVQRGDDPALAEAWNEFTDYLCKDGKITSRQYRNWEHPKFTKADWLRAYGKG